MPLNISTRTLVQMLRQVGQSGDAITRLPESEKQLLSLIGVAHHFGILAGNVPEEYARQMQELGVPSQDLAKVIEEIANFYEKFPSYAELAKAKAELDTLKSSKPDDQPSDYSEIKKALKSEREQKATLHSELASATTQNQELSDRLTALEGAESRAERAANETETLRQQVEYLTRQLKEKESYVPPAPEPSTAQPPVASAIHAPVVSEPAKPAQAYNPEALKTLTYSQIGKLGKDDLLRIIPGADPAAPTYKLVGEATKLKIGLGK